ncbi:MAG: flavin reductase family protein [Ferrimicrobium sp.]|jgi:flavin reductase (DIM6/NTAB) family NADH-FMN oxidoreductase RutF|nr:flavin reductase family protein [Ferrimicrobium sp.]
MSEIVATSDDAQLRSALWAMTSGLYLLSLSDGSRTHLMTISLVMQAAKHPRRLAMSIEEGAIALGFLAPLSPVGLVLLEASQAPLARKFAKPPVFEDQDDTRASGVSIVRHAESGLVMPCDALGMLIGRVYSTIALESHWLVVTSVDSMVTTKTPSQWTKVLSMSDTRMRYGG